MKLNLIILIVELQTPYHTFTFVFLSRDEERNSSNDLVLKIVESGSLQFEKS